MKLINLFVCFSLFYSSLPAQSGELFAGAAKVSISPPAGTPMAGYYYHRFMEGIHDDLFARALVLESGGTKIAWVECDLIGINAQIVARARRLVTEKYGFRPDQVMIGATHSHTGPVIPGFREQFAPRQPAVDMIDAYAAGLPEKIAAAIGEAYSKREPASLLVGTATEESVSFNRRYFMKDGSVGWNPGKNNPAVYKPAGPIDPQIGVLFAVNRKGEYISSLVNFALHLDCVGGTYISADIPATLDACLSAALGKNMTVIFSQGCSGNINHINTNEARKQSGPREAERIGKILAGDVIRASTQCDTVVQTGIRHLQATALLPLASFPKDSLAWARQVVARYGESGAAPFLDFVKAFKYLDLASREGKPLEAEVQVFAIGNDLAIVALPAEVFTELGMYIKRRSPFKYTFVTTQTNASLGYLPDYKAYAEGNYEPLVSRAAAGGGEKLADTAARLLYQLKNSVN